MQSRGRRWAGWVARWLLVVAFMMVVGVPLRLALGDGYTHAVGTTAGIAGSSAVLFAIFGYRQHVSLRRGAPPSLTPAQCDEAARATRAGSAIPTDPLVRQEAIRLLRSTARSAGYGSSRPTVILFAVLGLVLVVLGFVLSPWWFVVGGAFLLAALRVLRIVSADTTRLALLVAADQPATD